MNSAASLDLERDGKRMMSLDIGSGSGEDAIRLPVCVIRRGDGPGVLFTGGIHGDEYEGPIALMNLIRTLEADNLHGGTVIAVPFANPPAIAAATRTSPVDGQNLNRVFPGNADGTPTERIAHRITTELLPHVETHYDLHAGGVSHTFIPSVMFHKLDDASLQARTIAAMEAFRAPAGIMIKEFESEGMVDTTAERMGKVFGCCELGGAGMTTPEKIVITETGIRNLMIHLGIMHGEPRTPAWRGKRRTLFLEALTYDRYVFARQSGIFEPLVDLEDRVEDGQPVGRIHMIGDPGGETATYHAPAAGIVYSRHAFGRIERGRRIALVAEEKPQF